MMKTTIAAASLAHWVVMFKGKEVFSDIFFSPGEPLPNFPEPSKNRVMALGIGVAKDKSGGKREELKAL